MKLAYLFECHFNDGTIIQQTEEDVSKIDPNRSSFYDVIQRKDDVEVFGIFNDQHTYAVDLRDGHFEIDGAPFSIQKDVSVEPTEENPTPVLEPFVKIPDQKLELVYFRRHVHVTVMGQENVPEDISHSIEFFMGWKTTVNGKEVQQTISVS